MLRHVCILGNTLLVTYLIERKKATPRTLHLKLAIASGQLDLVRYLWDEKRCIPFPSEFKDLINKALISGNFPVLEYVQTKTSWIPNENHLAISVSGGGLRIVQLLHQEYKLLGSKITILEVGNVRNLDLLKYVVEEVGWEPRVEQWASKKMIMRPKISCMVNNAYAIGVMEIIQYVEAKYQPTVTMISLLSEVVRSGNLSALHHFLNKYPIKLCNFDAQWRQSYLNWAISSGNLEMVKYLINECNIIPTAPSLIDSAIQGQSMALIELLVDNYNYTITIGHLKSAISSNLLIMFDKLLEKSGLKDEISIAQLCTVRTSETAIHYLLSKHHFKIDVEDLNLFLSIIEKTKDAAFGIGLFDYLITVREYQPTPKIAAHVDWMRQNLAVKEVKSLGENIMESRCSSLN